MNESEKKVLLDDLILKIKAEDLLSLGKSNLIYHGVKDRLEQDKMLFDRKTFWVFVVMLGSTTLGGAYLTIQQLIKEGIGAEARRQIDISKQEVAIAKADFDNHAREQKNKMTDKLVEADELIARIKSNMESAVDSRRRMDEILTNFRSGASNLKVQNLELVNSAGKTRGMLFARENQTGLEFYSPNGDAAHVRLVMVHDGVKDNDGTGHLVFSRPGIKSPYHVFPDEYLTVGNHATPHTAGGLVIKQGKLTKAFDLNWK